MTQEQFKELLRCQQGKLNAVLMSQNLAKVVKTGKERNAFLQLAKEEGRYVPRPKMPDCRKARENPDALAKLNAATQVVGVF